MSFNIEVEGGKFVRLPTAGKYCDRDIVITATGGGSGGEADWVVVVDSDIASENTVLYSMRDLCVSFPNVTAVNKEAFAACHFLKTVDLPQATTIGIRAFKDSSNLTTVNMPNAASVEDGAFMTCYSLKSISLPFVSSIADDVFNGCYRLTTVDLPVATSIGARSFNGCDGLTTVDLPVATSIGGAAFGGCNNLSALILRTTETVCVVDFTAIYGTPIINLQGFVYVPTVMYEYYRAGYSAALDAAFAEMGVTGVFDILFRKIEDYPEICGQ